MAATQTCAQKTLFRIGSARGNLAVLGQPDPKMMSTILHRFALQYRISPNAMTKSKLLADATPEHCAATLVTSLDGITADAGFIRGINHVDAEVVNSHLAALVRECSTFTLAQELSEPAQTKVAAAIARFNDRGFHGEYAGSALPAISILSSLRA